MPEKPPVIPDGEVASRLEKELPGWKVEDGWIRRKYSTDGWPTTLMLVNVIGYLSEAAYHHPDLEVGYGHCLIKLQTHAIDGLSENDFICAAKFDALL